MESLALVSLFVMPTLALYASIRLSDETACTALF